MSTSATLSGNELSLSGAVTFRWQQISGNVTATITNPTNATTTVNNLMPGIYMFTLTITNNSARSQVDTATVSVLEKMNWNIEGTTREALVHPPAGGLAAAPVIFAFHGHGGTDSGFAEKAFELSWPDATVVYPQGLPTIGGDDPEAEQSGWQHTIGEVNSHTGIIDQDLKFFDAMLSTFKQSYHTNPAQVFAHGWSNGGEFVYNVLWPARGNQLAALAPAAATVDTITGKVTIPVIHTAGTLDDKVPFIEQQQCVQEVRLLDKCSSIGTTWMASQNGLFDMQYASSINDPVVFVQYDGSHAYPFTVPPIIVKFFKEVAAHTKG